MGSAQGSPRPGTVKGRKKARRKKKLRNRKKGYIMKKTAAVIRGLASLGLCLALVAIRFIA